MNVYVSSKGEHGRVWLMNPEPHYSEKLLLVFDKKHAKAGVAFKRHSGANSLMKQLTDALDQAKVPWANLRTAQTGVLTVEGKDHEFFLMIFDLIGPLPRKLADKMSCETRRKSLGFRQSTRYGG